MVSLRVPQLNRGTKRKKIDPKSFQMPRPMESFLTLPSLLERRRRSVHLSSFLDTLDECHAVDLMKVLKAAL